MDQLTLIPDTEIKLAEHAAVIRALGKRVVRDVIEIGGRLTECKRIAGHGNWLPWLDREFGWNERTARNFMQAHELAFKSEKFADLELPVSALYLLAAPSTPDEARDVVLNRVANGETLTHDAVKQMIAEAKAQDEDRHSKQIAKLKVEYERQIKQLENDLSSSLSPDEIKGVIEKELAPLRKKIERYEKREAHRKEEPKGPKDEFGLRAQAIAGALQRLSDVLVITPEEVLKAQKLITKITGQTMASGLASEVKAAKAIKPWLDKFIQITRGLK